MSSIKENNHLLVIHIRTLHYNLNRELYSKNVTWKIFLYKVYYKNVMASQAFT